MARRIKVSLETGEESDVPIDLSEEMESLLGRFVEHADLIASTRVISDDLMAQLQVRPPQQWYGDHPRITVTVPDKPDRPFVSDLLMMARPVLLESEETYFHKVRSALGKEIADPNFRGWLGRLKERFAAKRIGSTFELYDEDGSLLLNLESLYAHYLNSGPGMFHRNAEKAEVLKKVEGILPLSSVEAIALVMVRDRSKAAVDLARAARVLLEGSDSTEADLR